MRVTRIHVEVPLEAATELALPEAAATHLIRVLRLREGDTCVLFNGDGVDWTATITAIGKRDVRVRPGEAVHVDRESPLPIVLIQGVARGEKMDLVLQKATELGVTGIVPVLSQRSEVKLDESRAAKRLAHWRSVVASACEQSGRARVPQVCPPTTLHAALDGLQDGGTRLWLDPGGAATFNSLAPDPTQAVRLAVGPEGGWSPLDRDQLEAAGFVGLRLGPRILRTETAGLAAIAALQARFGDFQA